MRTLTQPTPYTVGIDPQTGEEVAYPTVMPQSSRSGCGTSRATVRSMIRKAKCCPPAPYVPGGLLSFVAIPEDITILGEHFYQNISAVRAVDVPDGDPLTIVGFTVTPGAGNALDSLTILINPAGEPAADGNSAIVLETRCGCSVVIAVNIEPE